MDNQLSRGHQESGLSLKEKIGLKDVSTIEQAFDTHRTISALSNDSQIKMEIKVWVYSQVAWVSEFLDFKKRLSNEMEYQIATDALLDYSRSWTPEDFVVFFKKLVRGELGKLYERLKVSELIEQAQRYEELKCAVRERELQKHKSHDRSEDFQVFYEPQKKNSSNIQIQGEGFDLEKSVELARERIEAMKSAGIIKEGESDGESE